MRRLETADNQVCGGKEKTTKSSGDDLLWEEIGSKLVRTQEKRGCPRRDGQKLENSKKRDDKNGEV